MTQQSGPDNAATRPKRPSSWWGPAAAVRARRALARRSFTRLARRARLLVLVLAVVAGLSAALLVGAILGHPLNDGPSVASLLTGVTCLVATATALAIAARCSLVEPGGAGRGETWVLTAAVGVLGMGGLALLMVWDLPSIRAVNPLLGEVLGFVLWSGFGYFAYAFHRLHAPGASTRERASRAVQVIVGPSALIVVAVFITAVAGNLILALGLLQRALALTSFASIFIVPTLLVRAGLAGLAKSRDRADIVSRILPDTPARATWFLIAKAAALLAVVALIPLWSPGAVLVSSSPLSWVGAFVAGGLVVLLLWFDHQPWPARRDLKVLRTAGGLLLAVPLGILVAVAFAMGIGPMIVVHPWQAAAAMVVGLATWFPAHRLAGASGRRGGWLVATATGAAGWLTFGRTSTVGTSIGPVAGPTLAVAINIFAWSLGLLAVAFIVLAVARRQSRLLTYLVAVVVWIALNLSYPLWTPGVMALDIDLALIVLLCLAMAGNARGLLRRIDPAEVVVVAVAVFLAMDVPVLLRFAPQAWTTWLLAIAAMSAVGLEFWFELPALAWPEDKRSAVRSLSLTCLAVSMTAALAWSVGTANLALPENMANTVLGFVSLPVAVVLASQSLKRPGRELGTRASAPE